MRRSIFERYGGFTSVSKIVLSFYDKVLDSPTVSPYFANSDMKRLIDHQTKFMASLMGGPASYTNDQLERVHAKLGITDHFLFLYFYISHIILLCHRYYNQSLKLVV